MLEDKYIASLPTGEWSASYTVNAAQSVNGSWACENKLATYLEPYWSTKWDVTADFLVQ